MTGPACDLCGLRCGKHPWTQRFGDVERCFCCLGCQNVFLILSESGVVASGQDLRQTDLFKRSLALGLISRENGEGPEPREPAKPAVPGHVPAEEMLLQIGGMWCTSCAWLIEHALEGVPGVASAEASFASDLVKVKYYPQYLPPEHILQRINQLGYTAREYSGETEAAHREERDLLVRLGLAAFLWLNIMTFSTALYVGYFERIAESIHRGMPFLLMALATPVVFYCAQPIFRLVWRGLLNRTIRMEALLGLGIGVAYGYSCVQACRGGAHVFFDTASGIVTAVLAGKIIERGAKAKAARWITSLHRMLPNKVRLLVSGQERFVSVAALEAGEVFIVKTGERIAADGCVVAGESHADEALLTGESSPVAKHPGDKVVAGSVNLDGVLHVEATRTAGDSTLSRIIALVNMALTSRSPLERTADRVARIFVPVVMVLASLTFVFCYVVGGAGLSVSLMRGITVLIIACPCALGLATPLAITAAMGSAARAGILVSDSRVLETLGKVDTIIFDKTGTVTEGSFSLLDVELCSDASLEPAAVQAVPASGEARASRRTGPLDPAAPARDQTLSLLASIEQYSEHPLGRALVEFVRQRETALDNESAVNVYKGQGITGRVAGREVFVGNRRLAAGLGIQVDDFSEARAAQWESEGKTVTFFGWGGNLQGLLAFGDKLRDEAPEVVAELKRRGTKVHLVSGDSPATTRWIASCLGADSCQAEVLPEQKAEFVRRLQGQGAIVAMVGDGINDAPALAQADLGIAMGSGTDIAMKAAAVVLMTGSLRKILEVFDLAARTLRVVRQNLFWAFLYNTVGITFAVAGFLNPIFAAAAMLLSSLSVVGNSLRLNCAPAGMRNRRPVS
jgi:heavy metal translocating P-type ATPase